MMLMHYSRFPHNMTWLDSHPQQQSQLSFHNSNVMLRCCSLKWNIFFFINVEGTSARNWSDSRSRTCNVVAIIYTTIYISIINKTNKQHCGKQDSDGRIGRSLKLTFSSSFLTLFCLFKRLGLAFLALARHNNIF